MVQQGGAQSTEPQDQPETRLKEKSSDRRFKKKKIKTVILKLYCTLEPLEFLYLLMLTSNQKSIKTSSGNKSQPSVLFRACR